VPKTPPPEYAFDETLAALGHAIRLARKERGLSQEDLAHESGIDRSYCGAIERGERSIGVQLLARLAAALGMSIAELMLDARL
jgi:transcriptional regulator with XRE-family HTH domain